MYSTDTTMGQACELVLYEKGDLVAVTVCVCVCVSVPCAAQEDVWVGSGQSLHTQRQLWSVYHCVILAVLFPFLLQIQKSQYLNWNWKDPTPRSQLPSGASLTSAS